MLILLAGGVGMGGGDGSVTTDPPRQFLKSITIINGLVQDQIATDGFDTLVVADLPDLSTVVVTSINGAEGDITIDASFISSFAVTSFNARVGAVTFLAADIPNTAVTPASYTLSSITVGADGRITAASNGVAVTSFNTRTGAVTFADSDLSDTLAAAIYTNVKNITFDSKGRATSVTTGAVTTITVTDSSLSLSGTTTADLSLNVGHGNTWTGTQAFALATVKAGGSSGVAKIGGVLFDHFADVGNTHSDGTFDTIYTDTLAASLLGSNGDKVTAEYGGVFVSSATATRQVKLAFAGTTIFDTGALTLSLSAAWCMYVTIIRVSSSVVRYSVSLTTEGAALAAYTAVGELTGLTLSNTAAVLLTAAAAGVGAAANDIVGKLGTASWSPAA